ncbi:retrovirus-related pol polyprotein from transposon TNT 1-94 [Tanacetum coccineum]|uniref:Retrovirus-related pol polyprotein from transposon TNT 1-94 n=1 Tax=Tanacetum coccineum TaxID=301880 RepID=A0ABQ5GDK3_9ASTR
MDSIILIGKKNTLAEYMLLSGADNRPPMLDKDLYDSWKSIMELYMLNREHGIMILESVKHGLLIWPMIKENWVTRTKKYAELSATEKIQANCDLKATNIILQGLPSDIYSIVNHHRVSKDLREKVQLLMQGTSLTKQERECKLKFVTDVKLVKELHSTNFDQLHAYLEQHELHANEVRLMRERSQDPLALVANHQMTPSHFNTYQSSYNNPHTSGTRTNTSGTGGNYSGKQRVVKCFNCQGEGHMARQCPKPKRKRDATWFGDKVLLVEAQGNGKVLNEKELEFLADPGIAEGPVTQLVITHNVAYQADDFYAYNSDCNEISIAKVVLMANLSSYDLDVLFEDTNSSTQQDAMILSVFEQLSNQVTNCNKVNKDNLIANESLSAELERYKEWFMDFEKEINYLKQTFFEQSMEKELLTKTFDIFKNESKEKEAKNIDTKIALENIVKELDNIIAQQIRPMLYDGSVIAKENIVISIDDSAETLMLEEESRSKMLLIQKLSNGQALHPNSDQSASSLVKIEAPRELPKDANTFVKVNSSVVMNDSMNYVEMCNKCLKLEAELIKQHNMVEKDKYNKLSKRFSELEQHFISLEIAMQLNKEIFQKNNTPVNQTEPSFDHLFELNNLKAELQAKDITIKKLKEKIKRKDVVDNTARVLNATTIAPGMYKLDPVTLAPKDKNNREAHIYYLKHTMEQAAIGVEQAKSEKSL